MKGYVIILIFCFVYVYGQTLPDYLKREIKGHADDCLDEFGILKSIYNETLISKKWPRGEKIDCATSCLFRKLKFQLENGTFVSEVARERTLETKIDMELYDKALDQCKNLVGNNRCETAGNVFECFLEKKTFMFFD